MSSLLTWQAAARGHIEDLNHFVCTDFVKPKGMRGKDWPPRHLPRWWEWEVQQELRDLHPPAARGRVIRVGYDDVGLAAVAVAQELDGPSEVEWEYGAIALRLRRKGGGYADEMCRELFDELTLRALQEDLAAVRVVGYVWEENRPSQALLRRSGFLHTDQAGEGVQFWEQELLVAAPPATENP